MDPFSYTAMSVTYQRAYAGTDDHSYIAKAEDAMEKSRQVAQQQQSLARRTPPTKFYSAVPVARGFGE